MIHLLGYILCGSISKVMSWMARIQFQVMILRIFPLSITSKTVPELNQPSMQQESQAPFPGIRQLKVEDDWPLPTGVKSTTHA
jgi:hypothetical protein